MYVKHIITYMYINSTIVRPFKYAPEALLLLVQLLRGLLNLRLAEGRQGVEHRLGALQLHLFGCTSVE